MRKSVIIMCCVALVVLLAPSYSGAVPVFQRPAVATVTEAVSGSVGNWTYTYTLHNTDIRGIFWWGVWFTSDPVARSESNNRAGWAFIGNDAAARSGFFPDPGPAGEPGLLWTWDDSFSFSVIGGGWQTVTSPNAIMPGETDVFQFTSATLFPGAKNFFYDTVAYWNGAGDYEAGPTTGVVPLPASLFLFVPGLAGLAAIRRRFKK